MPAIPKERVNSCSAASPRLRSDVLRDRLIAPACSTQHCPEPVDQDCSPEWRVPNDGPVLVDAVVNREELFHAADDHPRDGKRVYAFRVKAIMNGRGNELLELAETNLWGVEPDI